MNLRLKAVSIAVAVAITVVLTGAVSDAGFSTVQAVALMALAVVLAVCVRLYEHRDR